MLLAFIVIIIFLLHIQFYVRNIMLGTDEGTYFIFTIRYLFDRATSIDALYFSTGCLVCFAAGYLITHHRRHGISPSAKYQPVAIYSLPMWPLVAAGMLQILASFTLAVQVGFNYQAIAEQLEKVGFIFELRVVFLLFISHLLLNVPLKDVIKSNRYRAARITVYLYIIAMLLLQVRSRVFEIGAVLAFTHLMWQGDRLKLKYFFFLGIALIVPNIIVLGRLGWPDDTAMLIDGVFSFEYSVLFNNLLSASIEAGPNTTGSFTFTPSLGLLLPSPIRALLGIDVVKSDYYYDLSQVANIGNGGFSLLAELYTNFGWYALPVLGGAGALIGWLNGGAMRVGRASMLTSAAPLLYAAFILAFRNDMGVFIKYSIQLLLIAIILNYLTTINSSTNTVRKP